MKVGRSGVISAMQRKKRQDMYKDNNSDIELSQDDLDRSRLTIRRELNLYSVPMAVWTAGTFITLCGLYLLYHLIWGYNGRLFNAFYEGHWWQYLIACVIVVLGLTFIFAVSMERITISKITDSIVITKRNIVCIPKVQRKILSQLVNSNIVKRGQDSIQNRTLHYKIVLNFDDGSYVELLETNSQRKIKEKFIQFKTFLGQHEDLKNLQIVDESTKH